MEWDYLITLTTKMFCYQLMKPPFFMCASCWWQVVAHGSQGWAPDLSAGCSSSAWRFLPPFKQMVGHTAPWPTHSPCRAQTYVWLHVSENVNVHLVCFGSFLCTWYTPACFFQNKTCFKIPLNQLYWMCVHTNTIATCTFAHPCVYTHTSSLAEIDSLTHNCWYKKVSAKKRKCEKMRSK